MRLLTIIFLAQFLAPHPILLSQPILFPEAEITTPDDSQSNPDQSIQLGAAYQAEGNFEQAALQYQRALSQAGKIRNMPAVFESLSQLGTLYWNMGKMKDSLESYEQARNVEDEFNLEQDKEQILTFLKIHELYQAGKTARDEDRLQDSIEAFQIAVALAHQINSREHEVKCLRQLSVSMSNSGQTENLLPISRRALELARQIKHLKEEGRCLYNIGLFFDGKNNYSRALLHYQDALRIAKFLRHTNDESRCLTNISHIYIQLGNYEKALEYLNEVLKIDQQLGDKKYQAIDLNNIGVVYQKKALKSQDRNDLGHALDYFQKSLQLAQENHVIKGEIHALTNIGMIYLELGDYEQSLNYFHQGLAKSEEVEDNEEIANLLTNIGIIHSKQGDIGKTILFCQKALEKTSKTGRNDNLWETYFELANAFSQRKQFQEALGYYKKAIQHLEMVRSKIQLEELKATYLGAGKRIDAYNNLIRLLVSMNRAEPGCQYDGEAFFFVEKAKARAFLDRLEVAQVNISKGVDPLLLEEEGALMTNISSLNISLLRSGLGPEEKQEIIDGIKIQESDLESLKRKIRMLSTAYADLRYPQTITLQEVQNQLLDKRTAFFEYCLRDKMSYAFVITKDQIKILPLPELQSIQKMVTEYLKVISDKNSTDFSLGHELFVTLVEPGLSDKIERMIMIPDDILNYLPFESLLTEKNPQRWMIQDFQIGYAPSLSSLREIIRRDQSESLDPKKDILAVGDPDFGPNENFSEARTPSPDDFGEGVLHLPRLAYSGEEIGKIERLFPKTDTLRRGLATEERFKSFKLFDYKILHLASHTQIDDNNPARSAIVFSLGTNQEEDGMLQMREVFNLKLNSDLVTLSACSTGLGHLIKGEGIEGLSRAFFYAGASSALISLWAVNDQASAQFMERFYFNLRGANSIIDSLQSAKLDLIGSEVLSHPYYWAGFITTGDSSRVIFPSRKNRMAVLTLVFLSMGVGAFFLIRKIS